MFSLLEFLLSVVILKFKSVDCVYILHFVKMSMAVITNSVVPDQRFCAPVKKVTGIIQGLLAIFLHKDS